MGRLPTLSWLCVLRLAEYPEQVHLLPVRLNSLHTPALGPHPDPRLWATLVQIYDGLPRHLQRLAVPLADARLLQRIPTTPRFSLLTVLDLPACPHVTDASVALFSPLHSLVALDASATALSAYAIKALAGTLLWVDDGPGRRGPWPLRILRLRYCTSIDSAVYQHLVKFPLLCVIGMYCTRAPRSFLPHPDLRGTKCRPSKDSPFQPSSNDAFFHPAPLTTAVDALPSSELYSSPNAFSIVVRTLKRPPAKPTNSVIVPRESYVFARVNPQSHPAASTSAYRLQPPAKPQKPINPHKPYLRDCEAYIDSTYGSPNDWEEDSEYSFFTNDPFPESEDDSEYSDSDQELQAPLSPVSSPPPLPVRLPPAHTAEVGPDAFYRDLLTQGLMDKYDLVTDYSAEIYYTHMHLDSHPTSRHDAKLALYRPPPPWSTLDTHHPRPGAKTCKPLVGTATATVNRAGKAIQIDQARIDALRKSATARQTFNANPARHPLTSTSTSAPTISTPSNLPSRNPFRRQTTGAIEKPRPRPTTKPLKKISDVAVPLLPAKAKTPQPKACRSVGGMGLSTFADGLTPATPVSSKVRVTTESSTWAGSVGKPLRRDSVEVMPVAKKRKIGSDVAVPEGKKAEPSRVAKAGSKKGFDWGAWGAGGRKGVLRRSITSQSPRPYTFHIGASWAGKSGPDVPLHVPFPSDSVVGAWRDQTLAWPKSVRSRGTGQDFLFVQDVRPSSASPAPLTHFSTPQMRDSSGISLGVADGVGGWVDSGVDPSLFSQALMFHAHRYSRNAWAGEPEIDPTLDYEEREEIEGWEMTPYECLDLAYGGVLREKYVQAGSSTACLITMNASSGVLRSANLGDSGFMVIRSNSILYKQRAQTHFFNCPKQLTKLPVSTQNLKKFSRACIDKPSEAETFRTKLGDGDIVIAYTDGLSDNVFTSEIVTICSLIARRGGTEDQQVQAMADRLVEYARQCMSNKGRISPFESASQVVLPESFY
ncbi:hypothetical protein H0H81_003885 [Sphagnurus paluster]|uniref:PPM-type phosphatase domain-containing protein n=1 Tax=Sphagnurus paluster TaxID=117069 RepID=A0A9P7GMW7_9AGAR|nr:hypothetical protein H0H81_003885 [Sphagnurus paluster]